MEYVTTLKDPEAATTSVHNLSFTFPIQYYDFHVYYYGHNQKSRDEAFGLLDKLIHDFPEDAATGAIIVKKLPDNNVIGPHSTQFWEADVLRPEVFIKVLSWFQLHHGNLSVLIHPQTGNDTLDHTARALWLGDKLPVITSIFKDDGSIPEFGVRRGSRVKPEHFAAHRSEPQTN